MAPDIRADKTITLSISEIRALSRDATRGSERSWADANEAATACVWLARTGLDWATPLLALLDASRGATPEPAQAVWSAPGRLCPLRTGMVVADFALLPDGPGHGPLRLSETAVPVFLLPFVARAASLLGVALTLRWPGVVAALGPGGALEVTGPVDAAVAPEVRIARTQTSSPHQARSPPPATRLCPAQHARLLALALGTTVPTSARSETGAGGLGGDND